MDLPPDGFEGFVYQVTVPDGRKYIGQKKFNFKRTKTLKGKKVRQLVESDWRTYYGSSEEVKQLVQTLGPEGFKREVLHLCRTKSEMNYCEAIEILSSGALLSEGYLNRWVSIKINAGTVENKIRHSPVKAKIEFLEIPKKTRSKR